MQTFANHNLFWFGPPLVALKAAVVCVLPWLWLYENALEWRGLSSSAAHELTPYAEAAVAYLVAAALLGVVGAYECVRRRPKKAMWDLSFASLAVFCAWALFLALSAKTR